MNEKLLEQLATRLGTTSEYLWNILIKQAPVQSTYALIQAVLIMLFGVVLWKLHKHFSKSDDSAYSRNLYDKHDSVGPIMVIVTGIWVIMAVIAFFCIPDILNGFYNPEFWALDYIFDAVSSNN